MICLSAGVYSSTLGLTGSVSFLSLFGKSGSNLNSQLNIVSLKIFLFVFVQVRFVDQRSKKRLVNFRSSKLPMGYYICSGIDPATVSHVKYKVHGIVEISSIILNILIYARIKIYQNPKILPFSLKTNQPVLKKCLFLQVSISPTLSQQLFRTKVKQGACLYLQFRFKCFCRKEIGQKSSW